MLRPLSRQQGNETGHHQKKTNHSCKIVRMRTLLYITDTWDAGSHFF